jgi:hypothetical protein
MVADISEEVLNAAPSQAQGQTRAEVHRPVAAAPAPQAPPPRIAVRSGGGRNADMQYSKSKEAPPPVAAPPPPPPSPIEQMARNIQSNSKQFVVEGFADKNDADKYTASLERANRAREQLIRNGVDPGRVIAVGSGEKAGRNGGVSIAEAPPAAGDGDGKPDVLVQQQAQAMGSDPIGASHFESKARMTVPRGTSAMVSILSTDTAGEVVYYFDPQSPRGNAVYPFRAVRVENPTDSVLEQGPVTVFGEGKFVGEGMVEPIPPHMVTFIPFALDRQIVVERKDAEVDRIARVITVQRGVFSTEVQHTRRAAYVFNNRSGEAAVVYVRHLVAPGYKITLAPELRARLGAADVFRVDVPAGGKAELTIEEATPVFQSHDIRSPAGMELVSAYLSSAAAQGPLKAAVGELVKLHREMANVEQQIATTREQMGEYRARMDELHAQVVTLKAVKTAGPLMTGLEKKLQEVSDKLSKATIDLVALQERAMVTRIKFQDGVADLSLEKKSEGPPPAKP